MSNCVHAACTDARGRLWTHCTDTVYLRSEASGSGYEDYNVMA